jgi:hypothetical protein
MLKINAKLEESIGSSMKIAEWIVIISGAVLLMSLFVCYKIVWLPYLKELTQKIWRTKGLLNLIPMQIVKTNEMLKNEFTSGKFENAIK